MSTILKEDVPKLAGVAEVWPINVDQYHRMAEVGILQEDDPIELLWGYMVGKDRGYGHAMPKGYLEAPRLLPIEDIPKLGGIAALWPLSIDQYHRMIDEGIIENGAPVEFIEGYLIAKDRGRGPGMTHNPAHVLFTHQLHEWLTLKFAPKVAVRCQFPLALGPPKGKRHTSEPEPDIAIIMGPHQRYATRHPTATDVLLAIEVADSSLRSDRVLKTRLYAAAGISQYWIVNLVQKQIEVFTAPTHEGYQQERTYSFDDEIDLSFLGAANVTLKISDIVPK